MTGVIQFVDIVYSLGRNVCMCVCCTDQVGFVTLDQVGCVIRDRTLVACGH